MSFVMGSMLFLDDALSGKPGKHQTSVQTLMLLDPEVCAYLTLKYTIDGVSTRSPFTRVAMKLANGLEDQFKFDLWQNSEDSSTMFRLLKKRVNSKTTNRVYRRYNAVRQMSKVEMLDHEPWSKREKLHLGTKLIDILIQTTGLMEVKTVQFKRKQRILYLQANDATIRGMIKLNKEVEQYIRTSTRNDTTEDWSNPYNGGYHSDKLNPFPMIKTRNREYLEEMMNHSMPLEYGAINALQRTQWKVNERLLKTIRECWDTEYRSWANLPPREDYKVLPSPVKGTKATMTEEELDKFIKMEREGHCRLRL